MARLKLFLSILLLFIFPYAHSQIFQDDVMNETTGSFPSKWDVVNGSAMANVAPTGEKAIEINHLSIVRPVVNGNPDNYLGDEFTITFKVFFEEEEYLGRQEYLLRLWNGSNYKSGNMKMGPIHIKRHGASTAYFDPQQKNVSKYFPLETLQNLYDPNTNTYGAMWRTIKAVYQQGTLTLFIDENPIFVIPKIPLEPTMFSIGAIEKQRGVKDYFTAFKDVAVYNSATPEPTDMGCDALRMELIDGYWKMFWDPQDPPEYAPIINIEGNEGIIVHSGNYTGRPAGEKLWKNIKPIDDEYFNLEYNEKTDYGLKIKRLNIDEFVLREYREDGDSIQTIWQRVPKYYESEGTSSGSGTSTSGGSGNEWPKEIPNHINEATILWPGPPGTEVDYYADTVIDITATLEIMNGVTIEFGENGGLGVYDDGWLVVSGVGSSKVVLKAKNPDKGWRGIHIDSDNQNGIYETDIENAGRMYVFCCDEKAAIFIKNGGELTVSGSTITDSRGCGIYVEEGGRLTNLYNTFSGNADGDVCRED